jgi:hypothetical protein
MLLMWGYVQCEGCALLHVQWVEGGKVGHEPRCEPGHNLHCKECARWSRKCSFVLAKSKGLKWGANDAKEPKQTPGDKGLCCLI